MNAKVMRIDDMESVYDGLMVRARASLGATSFGMQVLDLPPSWGDYPDHTEEQSRQEELYIPIGGSGKIEIGNQEHDFEPGVMALVGPDQKRKVIPGAQGLKMVVIGGVPGKAYEAPAWTELGAPAPQPEATP